MQSVKGMTSAALDSLDQALNVGLPVNLKSSAEDLKARLADEREKRKQNPKILLAQRFQLWSEPGYAGILSDQRDIFLTTIAPSLGPKENMAVWGPDYSDETMLLQSLIAQVRRKIEPNPSQPRHIVTIPWVGYRFD